MNRQRTAFAIVVVAVTSAGCISLLGPEDLRFRLSLTQNVGLDRKFAVGVDGLTIGMASALAGPGMQLKGLTWVDVGVYQIRGEARNLITGVDLPGYETIVRVRDGDSEAKVFVQQTQTALQGLIVLARDGNELVIARLRGRLDQLLDSLMKNGSFDLDMDDLVKTPRPRPIVSTPREVERAAAQIPEA